MGTKQRADIVMSEAEIADFVNSSRTGTLATIGPDGQPHLTAMWYAVIDGEIWLETKAKSQKAVNLRRDPRVSFLLEDGDTYDTLRGVSFEGVAEIVEEPEALHRVGGQRVGTLHRPLHRRVQTDGRPDDEQAGRCAHRGPSDPLVGSPQAGAATHVGGWLDRPVAARRADAKSPISRRNWAILRLLGSCSPDGIRTHATAVRGRRPRPLDDGAGTDPSCQHSSRLVLGYQDSNLEWLNQNQLCCQLHHTPWAA